MTIDRDIEALCRAARAAARALAPLATSRKDAALAALAAEVRASSAEIGAANERDLEAARARGASSAMLDRLALGADRIEAVARSVEAIVALPDPVGELVSETTRPNGLVVRRERVPLGVIAMIYEARPNVTVEASALTLKAGNAVVLRGGSEAFETNQALARVIARALEQARLPAAAVTLVPFTDRDAVRALVQQSELVDLAIPRGGEALIRFVTEHARVPVVQHYKGVCHMVLDTGVDAARAASIVVNAKLSRPAVCNALECLLVVASESERLLPPVLEALTRGGCVVHGCERTRAIVPSVEAATGGDWGREFLDRVLAVRVVDDLDGAIAHIERYGSGHTEAILTGDAEHAERFRRVVDAACVVVNASTRFHDGGELGLGSEIGIATSRLHWRGPMGLEALTTMKWVVLGDGQVR